MKITKFLNAVMMTAAITFGGGAVYAQQSGGSLVFLVQPEPPTMAGYVSTSGPIGLLGPKIYDGLFDYDNDGKMIPVLAESVDMSEDLRIKKLRGSGGFVIAQVTDEQQSKGNLGGPDLFLAPIGRLDVESIKKYTCNTCDKEYEGSPKIEYENPNEEVAENLILVERGQYICTTCGSPIAEYREFQKPNESVEVAVVMKTTLLESSANPER